MSDVLIFGLIGLAQSAMTVGAFSYMGHKHAQERTRLLDAALSSSAAEFAIRQRASQTPQKASTAQPQRTLLPDGL